MQRRALLLLLSWAAACAQAAPAVGTDPPPGDDAATSPPPDDPTWIIDAPGPPPVVVDLDAGAADQGDPEAAQTDEVSLPPSPPFDPGEGGVCPGSPAPGDLVVDELMIESVAGTGDHGEWLELRSTQACAMDIRGLHGDAPSGSRVRTFDVVDDVWIPALGTLVVADSNSAILNHALPGPLVVWSGQPGDVLRNKGDTVTLRMNGLVVDSVTYPALTLAAGTSIAFPDDCAPSQRSDWTTWQPSVSSWFPGFFGTPNAPNTDVHCP